MDTRPVDWTMGARATMLVDWRTASQVGRRLAGSGPLVTAVQRARIREDFAELVPHAESIVCEFTGLAPQGYRSRPWVMGRGEWLDANLRGVQRLLEPLAERIVGHAGRGEVRRKTLAAQIGGLLGYISRRVIGQYDVFLPPDDDGLLYFIGPNVAEIERRFALPPRDFRLWISLHEVTHRVQFGATPWLGGYVGDLIDTYLATVELDPRALLRQLRRAADEIRRGALEWRGLGVVFVLMTPEQRELFHRMQSVMSLLEGHANFVMNRVAAGRVRDVDRMRRSLRDRRKSSGVERSFQRAIGFENKVRQYGVGERFVASVVERVGMEGLNRVWESEANLPSVAEVSGPDDWVARVAGG